MKRVIALCAALLDVLVLCGAQRFYNLLGTKSKTGQPVGGVKRQDGEELNDTYPEPLSGQPSPRKSEPFDTPAVNNPFVTFKESAYEVSCREKSRPRVQKYSWEPGAVNPITGVPGKLFRAKLPELKFPFKSSTASNIRHEVNGILKDVVQAFSPGWIKYALSKGATFWWNHSLDVKRVAKIIAVSVSQIIIFLEPSLNVTLIFDYRNSPPTGVLVSSNSPCIIFRPCLNYNETIENLAFVNGSTAQSDIEVGFEGNDAVLEQEEVESFLKDRPEIRLVCRFKNILNTTKRYVDDLPSSESTKKISVIGLGNTISFTFDESFLSLDPTRKEVGPKPEYPGQGDSDKQNTEGQARSDLHIDEVEQI